VSIRYLPVALPSLSAVVSSECETLGVAFRSPPTPDRAGKADARRSAAASDSGRSFCSAGMSSACATVGRPDSSVPFSPTIFCGTAPNSLPT
jgi:hypothetical protein